MRDALYPVQWAGALAVVALPEHIDVSNAGQIREELLSAINRGAQSLIADMTSTISCDHAGTEAMVRAHQRAVAAGAELRLVVTAQIVARVLSVSGVDRLVSIYPSLEAATAARPPAPVLTLAAARFAAAENGGHAPPRRARPATVPIRAAGGPDGNGAAITPAVVWKLVDALPDGVALTDARGAIALANCRLEEMFGYRHGEVLGRPVDSLIPACLQEARGDWVGNGRGPRTRPMVSGARLVGLRKDGTTFPAEISFSPVATAGGQFALTVIRHVTEPRRLEDLASLAAAAVAAEQARRCLQVLDTVVTSLFGVGLGLQAAMDLPAEASKQSIGDALSRLDDTIREIREAAFTTPGQGTSHPARADVTA
jgi:anti-anti-sigma factor